ncbi:uncharacterized protein [Argopecten irradians]|uniref:uncharacterized protein n=1 Tax=Argopecten irradians TaxID=31199 RepID=UPI00372017BD
MPCIKKAREYVIFGTKLPDVTADDALDNTQTISKDNRSTSQRRALHSLQHNAEIVIKPADKGAAVVIMNRRDYISEANRQLSNAQFYQKLDRDPTEEHSKLVKTQRAFYDQRTLKRHSVSHDGCCLYTNIPHGIAACRAAWDRRVSNHPSTQSLVDLLKLALTLNNFKFNDDNYLQISGTAMDTKMAPSYANVFMGHLESAILTSAPIQPFSWLRFVDDIEIKWTSNR